MIDLIDVYIDFDGVMVDTINDTYKMMDDLGISLSDTPKVHKFYKELDWDNVLSNTKEINDAFENIELLKASGLYRPHILTTVHSCNEMRAKVSFVRSKNKTINVICVPKGIEKCDMVDPKKSILVDDYGGNLKSWIENEGLGIKFSEEKSAKYITIKSLNELLQSKEILCLISKYIQENNSLKLVNRKNSYL